MLDLLTQPFDYAVGHVLSGNKRLFWLYLLTSFALALWVLTRQNNFVQACKKLFSKRLWLHQSAKQDYVIWLLNGAIKTSLILPLLFSAAPIAIYINQGLESIFGSVNLSQWPSWSILTCFTVILFLLDDFTRFLLHWLSHRVPLLWRFHQVHHSAEVLTPVTVYRIHPIESALYAVRLVLVQGLAMGIGVYFFSYKLAVVDVFGANLFVFVFNVFGANLRHSHIWLSWGRHLEHWFISPAQHQIHHSLDKAHYDKNFGSALAIWDKLFGSLLLAADTKQPEQFGLKNKKLNSIFALYVRPFINSK